jgi:membrane-bound ClpP family serine protease
LVTTPGRVLQVTGDQAAEYRLTTLVVNNFAQFKQHYGLENDPSLVEPGWADHVARFLRSTEIAVLLLIVGVLALYIELHTPGMGIGGFLATVCFALFFWSRYLEGTAGWLEVTLFLTGVVCILLEIFVLPGLGIFGLGGGLLILASIVLASQTFWLPKNEYQLGQLEQSMLMLAAALGGGTLAILAVRRWLPHAPVLQHVFLPPPEGAEAATISRREMLVDLDNLVGAEGVSTTPLAPGGKARFANHTVDVITAGEFVPRGVKILVTEVHGNRVVVRSDEASQS